MTSAMIVVFVGGTDVPEDAVRDACRIIQDDVLDGFDAHVVDHPYVVKFVAEHLAPRAALPPPTVRVRATDPNTVPSSGDVDTRELALEAEKRAEQAVTQDDREAWLRIAADLWGRLP